MINSKDLFSTYSKEEATKSRNIYDTNRSTSSALRPLEAIVDPLEERDDMDGAHISQISATAIQAMKLTLIAHNLNEVMNLGVLDPNQLYMTP